MKIMLCFLLPFLCHCEALAAGGQAFGNHPLGPQAGKSRVVCTTNYQQTQSYTVCR